MILLISLAPQAFGSGFTVDKWTTDEGLPQNSVISVMQSRDGYLWLGTLNGLVRFDGMRFKVFDESNTSGLGDSRIIKVFEDSDSNLWLGTETGGVVLVNKNGRVTGLDIGRGSRSGRLLSITEDRHKSVWLYTADGQLCRYNSGRVDVWNVGTGGAGATRVLAGDEKGLLWVGTDWSLAALDPAPAGSQGLVIAHEVSIKRKLEFILSSRLGGHWEIADGQIVRRANGAVVESLGKYPWSENVGVATACEDGAGNLVVGTYGEGVFWHSGGGKWTRIFRRHHAVEPTKEELSHNFAISLAFDREGSLWVGTDGGGLNRVRKQVFRTLAPTLDETVQSTTEDKWGRLWFGVNGGGARLLDRGLNCFASPITRSCRICTCAASWWMPISGCGQAHTEVACCSSTPADSFRRPAQRRLIHMFPCFTSIGSHASGQAHRTASGAGMDWSGKSKRMLL